MLKLNPIPLNEIDLVINTKIKCGTCQKVEISSNQDKKTALEFFHHNGWRQFETEDEKSGATCPSCIKEKSIENIYG